MSAPYLLGAAGEMARDAIQVKGSELRYVTPTHL